MVPTALALALMRLSPFALAFSGGLDSRFVAHCAKSLAPKGVFVHLAHVTGPHISQAESRQAVDWAEAMNLPLSLVPFDPLELPEVRTNDPMRCYHCKRAMFTALRRELDGLEGMRGIVLCDGSNASDAAQYRPGLKALKEMDVCSPLAEAGLDKASIRRIAAATGMDRPDQKARPCLLTRFAYGISPTYPALAALDAAEAALAKEFAAAVQRGLLPAMPDFRLRLTAHNAKTGNPGATPDAPSSFTAELHMDAPPEPALAQKLIAIAMEHGFAPPALHIANAISGHYDRTLKK